MIHSKPFNFGEMLRRTKFLPRPAFFNAEDLNKEFLTIHSFIEEFNKKFAVSSDIVITFNTLRETDKQTASGQRTERIFNLSWTASKLLFNGVQYQISEGGKAFIHEYKSPKDTVSPREVKPPTYIVLRGNLKTIKFSDNNELCGLRADETPNMVQSVEVEQYQDLEIDMSEDPSDEKNAQKPIICILGILHPKYNDLGEFLGFGYIKSTFSNSIFSIHNGVDREESNLKTNGTIFEYISERFAGLKQVLSNLILYKKFNLADLHNPTHARHNLGLSELVNRRQLVQVENLNDIPNKELARHNLGLGEVATANFGSGHNDVARGSSMPIGMIIMWAGNPNDIPMGWVECNGLNNTPDLRGRVPVGYDISYQKSELDPLDYGLNKMKNTGGNRYHKLEVDELPQHSHKLNDPGHSHNMGYDAGWTNSGSVGLKTNGQGRNTWSAKTGITLESTGEDKPHNNMQPYTVVMFIMYVGFTDNNGSNPKQQPLNKVYSYPNFSTPNQQTNGGYDGTGINIGSDEVYIGAVTLTNPD